MTEAVTAYREAFDSHRSSRPGAALDWLQSRRSAALAHFERTGFPGPRQEDWKYTRVAAIEKSRFATATTEASPPAGAPGLDLALGGRRLVFFDGRLQAHLSTPALDESGVTVLGLAQALESVPERVEKHLNAYFDPHRHAFTALNTALSDHGAFVHVAANHRPDGPLHLLLIASGAGEVMCHPRIVIVADEGSELEVVEHYVAAGDSKYLNNAVTEVSLGANAALAHYKLQAESRQGFHVSALHVHQQASSRFLSHSVSLGAALSRNDIDVMLAGSGAECTLNGLYMGNKRQHVDYHTTVQHLVPNCTSREDYKGVLGGRARGVFNGRVIVHRDAQKSDARQSNRNLLLSGDAEVDTKPQLEIHADDVKCAHGATIGQLDERMVFYMRSRGLSESRARALLVFGFAHDVVDRIALAPLREVVADALLQELPHAEELRSMLS